MAQERITDWGAFRDEQRRTLEAATPTRDEAIEEIRWQLRNIKQLLPEYQYVQDEVQYSLALQDAEEIEHMFREFVADDVGIFEMDDVIETLVAARVRSRLMGDIILDKLSQ